MLINLSNHPSSTWSKEQTDAAIQQFGGICDFDFPAIDPEATTDEIQLLAEKTLLSIASSFEPGYSIHVMGEFTFCHRFILTCRNHSITCYASTTKRIVVMTEAGEKISRFFFVQFRSY